jgi:adenylylsulfate kinase-like enzyme
MIKNKKKGILFWITGLSGAGKTSISKKIYKKINNEFGKTILINGDDLRRIFQLKGYNYEDRKKIGLQYSKLFKKITDQNINVIFAGVVLIESVRKWNKKNIDNYLEIYLKASIKKIIIKKYKKLYYRTKNLVGLNIKAELPKKPDIIIYNNFKKSVYEISKKLLKKIQNKIN